MKITRAQAMLVTHDCARVDELISQHGWDPEGTEVSAILPAAVGNDRRQYSGPI
jgi:hypothetical protein